MVVGKMKKRVEYEKIIGAEEEREVIEKKVLRKKESVKNEKIEAQ